MHATQAYEIAIISQSKFLKKEIIDKIKRSAEAGYFSTQYNAETITSTERILLINFLEKLGYKIKFSTKKLPCATFLEISWTKTKNNHRRIIFPLFT